MRVLCCLDGTNGEQVSKATEMLSATQPLTFVTLCGHHYWSASFLPP